MTEGVQVKEGMDVLGIDGEKLGSVKQVWTDILDSATNVTIQGYFQVDQGGLLGIGATHLYVPFGAITETVPGERVTIGCVKADCGGLYGEQPDFLARKE